MTITKQPTNIYWKNTAYVQCIELNLGVGRIISITIEITKINLQAELDSLHLKMELEEITHETITQEKSLNFQILKAASQEEDILRIKYHQLWIKGEDKNAYYFHKQTKIRLRFNYIKYLKDNNNQIIIVRDDTKNLALQHFNQLFSDRERHTLSPKLIFFQVFNPTFMKKRMRRWKIQSLKMS